jgi:tetratricopeptide (TPR) repeat protein
VLLTWAGSSAYAASEQEALVRRPWFELCTAHFNIYSCAPTQEVAKVAGRLEQFREAYAALAGAQAVTSPPIVVLAFPETSDMKPYLPLYQGQPANLAAFFNRGSDENLIVLSLAGSASNSLAMESIFHEYSHLLLRHNQQFWPMWLKEGMAEIYAKFEVTGEHTVRIGKPIDRHLRLLNDGSLMPLDSLFAVSRESPEYNEQEHQGIFYAQSWLLTHYLMLGDNATNKARFGQVTVLLRQGQSAEAAFTNAFRTTLPVMEAQLRRYLKAGKFEPLQLTLASNLNSSRGFVTRGLSPAEVAFRLGDELLRIGRFDKAEEFFMIAQKLAPASPLSYEGMGLLAAKRKQPQEAVVELSGALRHGSMSFLAHYVYALEKYQLTCQQPDRYAPVEKELAAEIRSELRKSLTLMPDFGPAHHLLGFFELVQGENLGTAEQHLQRALQLEPENQFYLFSIAQVQFKKHDIAAARKTLEALRLPYVEAQLRSQAEEMIGEISAGSKSAAAAK